MTDLPDEDDRFEKLAARVEPYLREGDRVVIEMVQGEIHIDDAAMSTLERRSPKLFGRLLALNERLEGGCGLIAFPLVFAGIVAYIVHARLAESWLGVDLNDKLASWWFYILLLAGVGGVGLVAQEALESSRYRRARPQLHDAIQADEADWDELIAEMHRIPDLANIYRRMKLDEPPRRGEPR